MGTANLKNLFNLEAVNRFFENLLEKKVPHLVFDYSDHSGQLQGIDMVQQVGKTAEQEKVIVSTDKIYLHECYVVYLHPEDYQRLSPLFNEIEKDTLEHLKQIADERNYITKGSFQVEFSKNEKVKAGSIIVVSSPRAQVAKTVLNFLELPEDTPLDWEQQAFSVGRKHDQALKSIFELLDRGQYKPAISQCTEFIRAFPEIKIARTLLVLIHFLAADETGGLRVLNEETDLAAVPYGNALKSMGYLAISDLHAAEKSIHSYFKKQGDDIAYLMKALVCGHQGSKKKADQYLGGALAINPELEPLIKHFWDADFVSKLKKMPAAASQSTQKPLALRLIDVDSNQSTVINYQAHSDLFFTPHKKRMSRYFLSFADVLPGMLPPETKKLTVKSGGGKLLGHFQNGETSLFQENAPLHIEGTNWHYSKSAGVKPENWKEDSQRNFSQTCHCLKIYHCEKKLEQWFFTEDCTLTVGRKPHAGNDWVIPTASISGCAHGEFTCEHGQFWFTDLKSSNGTVKNGKLFSGKTSLKHGDLLQLGSTSLEVHIGG
ncbi:MAG: hypothetical protein CSA81_09875 [Acidobacteria bacterium]|nr:MAG: hypothetical protein CSA81_09875 [Acidobacteriota bacterium]